MSTIYETAIDTVRETGGRLARELPSGVEWPDDLVDRVADEITHGFDALKGAVVPVATVAVGAGANAMISGGRSVRRHPALMVGGGLGVVAVVAVVIWLGRRRRTTSDQHQSGDVGTETRRPVAAA